MSKDLLYTVLDIKRLEIYHSIIPIFILNHFILFRYIRLKLI